MNYLNLKKHIANRDVVVWGTGAFAGQVAEDLQNMGVYIVFFVAADWAKHPEFMGRSVFDKTVLDVKKHYVVIGSTLFSDEIKEELLKLGFKIEKDFIPPSEKLGAAFRYDRNINGVFVGKYTSFPSFWHKHIGGGGAKGGLVSDMIESIGRFTSINNTAEIHADHNLKTLSTSVAIERVFDEQDVSVFSQKYNSALSPPNHIVIGNDVWIGAKVVINASKVKVIGDGAIIGTNAIVLEDVPPYAIVVGVPGKVKKYRYTPEQIKCLLRIEWWNWSDESLRENAELFYNPELFFEKFRE